MGLIIKRKTASLDKIFLRGMNTLSRVEYLRTANTSIKCTSDASVKETIEPQTLVPSVLLNQRYKCQAIYKTQDLSVKRFNKPQVKCQMVCKA